MHMSNNIFICNTYMLANHIDSRNCIQYVKVKVTCIDFL